ncbi:MAG: flavodoxin [Clostridia bacterium]|nr:flavodoxin [Clostridia bacterium]
MAVLSFLNYYELSDKTIYTFCTSGGSAITESTADIRSNAAGANIVEGRRFTGRNDGSIESWLDGAGLIKTPEVPDTPEQPETPPITEQPTENNILVVYFSAQNHTETVANYIATATGGELFELMPVNPYTSADLNYGNPDSRVSREHDDESLRDIELVSYTVENWETYDTVFIGYPIWWGIAAWPVNNFINNNDFTGKTVIPFCTAASSPIGQSGTLLAEMAGTGDWQQGTRFYSNASQSTVISWVQSLGYVA